ncbi:Fc receptor-like protein 6 isoform X2 [Mixophyes fleayi]|uniref:Fc receptor-like protein 6 isoform X2 n=1 Tax=Mixophyes fleayi TaxID=3061075 RepID=UPI003F4E0891
MGGMFRNSVLQINMEFCPLSWRILGDYTCEVKTSTSSVKKMSRESHVQIQLLLSSPKIQVTPYPATEGDRVTLTCDTRLSPLRPMTDLQFAFYKYERNVQEFSSSDKYGVPSAQLEDSGNYYCEVKTSISSVKSEEFSLQIQELFKKPKICVTPLPTTEGDNLTLTCNTSLSPLRQRTELQFAFYRDGRNVQGFSLSHKYGVLSAQLEDSGNNYCEVRTSTNSVKKKSRVLHVQIQELISSLIIKVTPYPVTEGDHMTLTCDTSLSPLRQRTDLQFAFYRDERNVQDFSSSDKYGVLSAQLEDSGNYTCEVKTSTNGVKKTSEVFYLQIKDGQKDYTRQNIIRLTLSACVLIIGSLIVFYYLRSTTNKPPVGDGTTSY